MENFWKAAGLVLVTAILCLAIGKTEKDFSVLLSMTVCSIIAAVAVSYLEPVWDLLWELNSIGDMESNTLGILLKAVGITLIADLAGNICIDAGNGSLSKLMQLLGSTVILYLSVPLIHSLLTLLRDILGEL